MKNIIIKSNKWYDNLSDGKHLIFFLSVIMSSLLIANYLTVSGIYLWAFPIWSIIFCIWRVGYMFIK